MTRREPNQYNWDKLQFDERLLTKHYTKQSSKQVRYVVVHHMVVKDRDANKPDALDAVYNIWQSRPASAHYGIDGRFIGQFVWDRDYAWATGNTLGNRHGISIEHVNSTLDESGTANDYKISEETWKNGAKLTAYIHKVYKMGRPIKNVTLRKHSSFSATACPGPFMDKIWDQYVREAQQVYDAIIKGQSPGSPAPAPKPKPSPKPAPKPSPAKRLLRTNTKGDDVKTLQRGLNKTFPSYSELVVDGHFGAKTSAVVREFQKRSKLTADGIVGAKTRAELAKYGINP